MKTGVYACKIDEYGNTVECCYAGDKPDFILIGIFDQNKCFIGRVITNWCDKYPSDSLFFRNKSIWDQGGLAVDENGENIWEEVSKEFPDLLREIESLYEYFITDEEDEEYYNLSKEIPKEIRLFYLYEGYTVNLSNVKKGNGEKLGVELFL